MFKCKTKSLPKEARTKVLQRNIFEDRNVKMRVHVGRPPILSEELMVPKWRKYLGKNAKCQDGPPGGRSNRTGPGWAQADWPGPLLGQCSTLFDSKLLAALPFAKNEDKYQEGRPQLRERLDRRKLRDTFMKTIHPSPRRQPPVKAEAEALPRRPRSWMKTLLERLPWSTAQCLESWWGKLSICPWGCNTSRHVITDSLMWLSIYCSCWWYLDT
jgi:hypothetical protein